MKSAECRGKFKCSRKNQTIVTVDNFEEYKSNYNNIMTCDAIIYNGDINEYISNVTPDNAKKVFLHLTGNPDIANIEKLGMLKNYNVMYSLPDGYCDMEQLYNLNKMYPNIHFCGGKTLYLEGINYGVIKRAQSPVRYVFTDEYSCQQDVIALEDVTEDYEFVQGKGESIVVKKKDVNKPKQSNKVAKENKAESKNKTEGKNKTKSSKFKTGGLSMF